MRTYIISLIQNVISGGDDFTRFLLATDLEETTTDQNTIENQSC